MLAIENIYKHFGGVHALRGATLELPENAITALIGPNGAGKTTLFDCVSGLVPPDSGTITFGTTPIIRKRPDQIANLGLGRTFQKPRLFRYLSIKDHLRMAEDNTDTHLFANLIRRPRNDDKRYEAHLQKFGIEKPLDTLVSDLSYGQRKLLEMAMVFLKPHSLVLLDEPVAGVNQRIQAHVESLLLHLKDKGEAITVIEHDMEFVKRLADVVVVMNEGAVLASGSPTEVFSDERVIDAYLGV